MTSLWEARGGRAARMARQQGPPGREHLGSVAAQHSQLSSWRGQTRLQAQQGRVHGAQAAEGDGRPQQHSQAGGQIRLRSEPCSTPAASSPPLAGQAACLQLGRERPAHLQDGLLLGAVCAATRCGVPAAQVLAVQARRGIDRASRREGCNSTGTTWYAAPPADQCPARRARSALHAGWRPRARPHLSCHGPP